MPTGLLLHELRQPLAAYQRSWSAVEIDVHEGTSAESLERPQAGEADVAIAGHIQGSPQESSSIQSVPLLEYPFVVLAPPGHPLLTPSRLKLTDLVKHPLVLTREGSFSRERVVGVLEEARVWGQAKASLTAGGVDLLAEYVRLGLGGHGGVGEPTVAGPAATGPGGPEGPALPGCLAAVWL